MLPNIEPAAGATPNAGAAATTRRAEAEKVIEAYKTAAPAKQDPRQDSQQVGNAGNEAAKTAEAREASAVRRSRHSTTEVIRRMEDQAGISFQLTREEREIFLGYVSGDEETDQMSEQEQTTLQRVAERLDSLIEEADARSAKGRNRIDAAMKEWYSRLSGGKDAPESLLRLIQQAAQGKLDDKL